MDKKNLQIVLIGPMIRGTSLLKKKFFNQFKKKFIKKNHVFFAIDHGFDHAMALGLNLEGVIGDWDSLKNRKKLKKYIKKSKTHTLPRLKSMSDFYAGLKFILSSMPQAQEFLTFGFLGGRRDHEWAVFLDSLNFFKKNKKTKQLVHFGYEGRNTIELSFLSKQSGFWKRYLSKGEVFSVFSWGDDTRVSIEGARFNLKNKPLTPGSLGLSNEGMGQVIKIKVHRGIVGVFMRNSL